MKIGSSLVLSRVLRHAQAVMSENYGIGRPPVLEVKELRSGHVADVPNGCFREDSVYIIRASEDEAAVSLTLFDVPDQPGMHEREAGKWAAVDVDIIRNGRSVALAAALALAVAIAGGSDSIVDDQLMWTPTRENPPEGFARRIALMGGASDLADAASRLCDQLGIRVPN